MGMKDASKPEDFLTALAQLQKACGVDNLKMSDYAIRKEECLTLARTPVKRWADSMPPIRAK